jgi:hypothetical protein
VVATTTTIPALLSTLCDQLLARAGLEGVAVFSGSRPLEQAALEEINLMGARMTQEARVLGNLRRQETYDVPGALLVIKAGKDEATIRAARDRACAIFAQIEQQLREDPSVDTTVMTAEIKTGDVTDGYSERGRYCLWEFTIQVVATLPTS